MLQNPRSRHVSVLGHVPHQQHGDAGGFRKRGQRRGYGARLRDAAGHAFHPHCVHGLHGVHDDEAGFDGIDMPKDGVQVGFGREVQRFLQRPGALGAGADLAGGFLGGGVEDGTAELSPAGGDLEKQRGFAHAGLAGHEHHRAWHDAGAQHAVELADARAHRLRRLRAHLRDGLHRARRRDARMPAACRCPRHHRRLFLHRPPRTAIRAAPEPLGGDISAFGAGVDGARFFGHGVEPRTWRPKRRTRPYSGEQGARAASY